MISEFNQIIEHFGVNAQLKKFNEEQFELIEAIRDYEEDIALSDVDGSYTQKLWEHLAEEIADCFVLLNQFKEHYGIDDKKLTNLIAKKVSRTINRINDKYYEKGIKNE